MSDADSSWWLGTDLVWRRGTPPPGWREVRRGRWQPSAGSDETTEELALVGGGPVVTELPPEEPARPEHLMAASGTPSRQVPAHVTPDRGLPPVVRTVATVLVVVGFAAGLATIGASLTSRDAGQAGDPLGRQPPPTAPPAPDTAEAPAQHEAPGDAAPSTTVATATSPSSPTATSSPPSDGGASPPSPSRTVPPASDPLAACTTGQRQLIERGNHPWSWYLERFDHNGDGVLCTRYQQQQQHENIMIMETTIS